MSERGQRLAERRCFCDEPLAKDNGPFSMNDLPTLYKDISIQYGGYPEQAGYSDVAMPVKMLEAVGYGRRVIGNVNSLASTWIEQNDWGWTMEPGDVSALADILQAAGEGTEPPKSKPLAWKPTNVSCTRRKYRNDCKTLVA